MFFRRKKKESKSVCVHDWYLIDTRKTEHYNGIDIDFLNFYTIGCVKCNERREMDEFSFSHFKNTFKVKKVH
ncbi:hypothetical protein ACDX78_13680 [Virgibacillus oceani]